MTSIVKTTSDGRFVVTDLTTKTRVRDDWAYARHCMRLAEQALKADDLDELAELAREIMGATATLAQYLDDRGVAV